MDNPIFVDEETIPMFVNEENIPMVHQDDDYDDCKTPNSIRIDETSFT